MYLCNCNLPAYLSGYGGILWKEQQEKASMHTQLFSYSSVENKK